MTTSAGPASRNWPRMAVLAATSALPLSVLAVLFVLPVAGMVSRGFFVGSDLDIGGVFEVLGRERVHRVLLFTLWSSLAGTALSLLLGIPAAYALHRLRLPLRRSLRGLLMVPFTLPTVVVGVAFRQLLGDSGPLGFLRLDGTALAIILALAFFNAAVVIRVVGTAWESLDPRPGEAAAALGAAPWTVFRTVTFPALRGAIVSAGCVVFLFCSTAFGVVLTMGGLRYSTVETEIYLLTVNLFDLRAAAALSVLQLVTVTGLLIAAQRLRQRVVVSSSRVEVRPRPIRVSDIPAVVTTGLLIAFVAAPIVSLLVGSLRGPNGWTLDNYRALNSVGEGERLVVPVTEALVNSLTIAADAAWMSLLLGVLVTLVVTRRSRTKAERRVRSVLDAIFMLPLGVSAVTLGFGFLVTLNQPPVDFRDSRLLVPMAQALVALPLVIRTLVPVLASIDDRQRQAAASLGASPWRAMLTVDLPALKKPVLAAAGFAFAVSLGEFGATSFLARDDRPTLPVVIYHLIGHPGAVNYSLALAACVVLSVLTALIMVLVERLHTSTVGAF